MVTSNPRVAPDGALLDRVSEFVYEPARIRTLFLRDEEGYIDAVGQVVQTISVGGQLVGGKGRAATQSTDKLKHALSHSGRLDFVEFFDDQHQKQRRATANQWLDNYWGAICNELADSTSEASSAFLGHMRREFHLVWLREDRQWNEERWYSKPEDSKFLPDAVRQRVLHEIAALASDNSVSNTEKEFDLWANRCATSHYRIFFEHLLFLSSSTGCEYMPALTRSSLRLLSHVPGASVREIVFPFVALEAVKKVKRREDLFPRVIEWNEGPAGRKIAKGIRELDSIVRSSRNPEEKQKILQDVHGILTSEWPRNGLIALNLYNLAMAAVRKEIDVEAAKNITRLAQNNSYRWLWSIRAPEATANWRNRVRELVMMPR